MVMGLALGVTVSNAFARFAYGLILPAMRSDLGWSYTVSGWINSANALGYVVGALFTYIFIERFKVKRLYIAGILITSVSLLMCGLGTGIWYLTFWRVIAGIAGAPVFIVGGAMAASLYPQDSRKNALAIATYFAGAGLGLILSGGSLPVLFENYGPTFWPRSWLYLGIASLTLAPVSIWAVIQIHPPKPTNTKKFVMPIRKMAFSIVSYGLFATGYIVYLTFIVDWGQSKNLDVKTISIGWALIGGGIIVSPFVWKRILARHASGVPLALACAATGLATLGPIFFSGVAGFLLSTFLFGLAVFIGPAAVTSFTRKNLPKSLWGRSISFFTVVFAIGQTIGPVVAGALGDASGTLSTGLLAAAGILLVAAALALKQKALQKYE